MAALIALLIALGAASANYTGGGPPGAPASASTDYNGSGPPGAPAATDLYGNGPPG